MDTILLEVKNIRKRFGAHEALKGVSLAIKRAEIISLLGANGAGKTTLSSIIATLRPPTEGDIVFKGKSIYADIPAYRHYISYCPQRPNLNNFLTLEENLIWAGRYFGLNKQAIEQRIRCLSDYFELHAYLKAYPETLSGGYKQRFLIARSLMHEPEFIIFDEPTVALDPHIRQQVWSFIKKLRDDGITILLTTHYLDEAEFLSDRVCVLDKGLIRLIDTPAQLMSSFQKSSLEDVFLQIMHSS